MWEIWEATWLDCGIRVWVAGWGGAVRAGVWKKVEIVDAAGCGGGKSVIDPILEHENKLRTHTRFLHACVYIQESSGVMFVNLDLLSEA